MKAELTSGTRGKFYRESTPGSRIKKGIKGVIKGVSKVVAPSTGIISKILTGGKSLPLEAARTGFTKPSSFKMKGFSGFGNNEYKNMIPKKTDKITQKDIDGFIKDMRPGKNDKITQEDIQKFIQDMKPKANATFTKIKRK